MTVKVEVALCLIGRARTFSICSNTFGSARNRTLRRLRHGLDPFDREKARQSANDDQQEKEAQER